MKSDVLTVISLLSLSVMLASCSAGDSTPDTAQLEQLAQNSEASEESDHSDIGSWLEPETEYENNSSDSLSGISVIPQNGNMLWYDGKLVFQTIGQNSTLYMYINTVTGEALNLCPDPLCHHNADDECKFMSIMSIASDNGTDGRLYVGREVIFEQDTPPYDMLSEVMDDGSLRDIFGHKNEITDDGVRPYNTYENIIAHNGKIYFIENISYYSNSNSVDETRTFYIVDSDTCNIEFSCNADDLPATLMYVGDDYYIFNDYPQHICFVTDYNFENRKDIYTYENSVSLTADNNTGDVYIYSTETDSDSGTVSVLYSCDSEWNIQPVILSTDQIVSIFITNEYIYFEKYSGETVYGTSPQGGNTTDTTGGIIYRLSRNNLTSEPEIVFDGHGEIFNYGYTVIGDNLYIKYKELHSEGSNVWWRVTGDLIRVNMKNNTIKWINTDS